MINLLKGLKQKYLIIISLAIISCSGPKIKSYKQDKTGVDIDLSEGTLGIYPLADNAVRIKFIKDNSCLRHTRT
jgi:hypothetical protein